MAITGNGDISKWVKILEWDDQPQTINNKQTKKYSNRGYRVYSSGWTPLHYLSYCLFLSKCLYIMTPNKQLAVFA